MSIIETEKLLTIHWIIEKGLMNLLIEKEIIWILKSVQEIYFDRVWWTTFASKNITKPIETDEII